MDPTKDERTTTRIQKKLKNKSLEITSLAQGDAIPSPEQNGNVSRLVHIPDKQPNVHDSSLFLPLQYPPIPPHPIRFATYAPISGSRPHLLGAFRQSGEITNKEKSTSRKAIAMDY